MQSAAAPTTARPERDQPWRRRLVRTLLYGKSVDRSVKARGPHRARHRRFALCYAVIAGRLVM